MTETRTRIYQLLAALQAADVATTWFILNHWGERAEGNPVVASLLGSVGLDIGLMFLLVFKLLVVRYFFEQQTPAKLAVAIYSAVIVNNLVFLALWAIQ